MIFQVKIMFLYLKKGNTKISNYNFKFHKNFIFSRRLSPKEATKISPYMERLPRSYKINLGEPEISYWTMRKASKVEITFKERNK